MRVVIISVLFLSGCYNMKESNVRTEKSVEIEEYAVDSAVSVVAQEEDKAEAEMYQDASEKSYSGKGSFDGGVAMEDKSEAKPPKPNPKPHSPNNLHIPQVEQAEEIAQDTLVIERDNGMGFITYYIPDTMKVGVEFKVNLRIGKKNSVSISAGLPSTSVKREIRVGKTMQAVIKQTSPDSDFKISELNTAIQTVENDTSFTTWEWSIIPLKSGKHGLKLVVVIKEDNLTKDIPVYEDNIYVYSSPLYDIKKFVGDNWKEFGSGAMSMVVIPLVVWWYNKRKKKNDEEEKPEV